MRVIIAAAGTGGHINPGIAIANKIKEEEKNAEILFIGTDRGLENDLVPRAGYHLKNINAYGINRKINLDNIKRLYKTYKSIGEAKKIIEQFKPDIVVGTGGYICIPVGLAARKKKISVVLHESNAFPGVAVKVLSSKINCVMAGFEDTKTRLPKAKKVMVTGTPTRIKNLNYTEAEIKKKKETLGFQSELPLVLVYGGSQGAQSINRAIIQIIKEKKNENYQIIWAAGTGNYDTVKSELSKVNINIGNLKQIKIVPYIYNMEEVMNAADLLVCRSGAMTITEVATVGKPAIFIPFPYATENHQEFNAKVLANKGAAEIILDKDLNGVVLHEKIKQIVCDRKRQKEMGEKAHKAAITNVEDKIYQVIQKVVKENK